MVDDPPEAAYRSSFQTTLWCCCQKQWYWAIKEKAATCAQSGRIKGDERKWTSDEVSRQCNPLTKLPVLCYWQDKYSRYLFTGYASTDIKGAWTLIRLIEGTRETIRWC